MSRRVRSRRTNTANAALPAVLMLALLGGCTGGDEPEPDADPSDSSQAPSGDETPLQVEADGLPEDFPRDEVPVVDGQIVSVSAPEGGEDDAYTLLLYLGDTTRVEAVSDAVGMLEDAGWSSQTTVDGEEPATQVLTKPDGLARQVLITNGLQRDETTLTYSVVVTG